jgi:2-polyprenyl-6-hydroxyphenyl methylase/3-demethylubiquinone-9 3-methyltransferase
VTIYDTSGWWDGDARWLRILQNMVPARFSLFEPIMGSWRDKVGLDLGCGGGFMSMALWERGAKVSAIDLSAPAIFAAQRHARMAGAQIDFRVGDGRQLPYAESSFDFVICVDVFEHTTDVASVISEIHRVLRPRGTLLFDTINRTSIARMVMVTLGEEICGFVPRGSHDPALFLSPRQLLKYLREGSFDVGRISGFGPRGIDRRGDVTFGRLPTTAIQYAGHAVCVK